MQKVSEQGWFPGACGWKKKTTQLHTDMHTQYTWAHVYSHKSRIHSRGQRQNQLLNWIQTMFTQPELDWANIWLFVTVALYIHMLNKIHTWELLRVTAAICLTVFKMKCLLLLVVNTNEQDRKTLVLAYHAANGSGPSYIQDMVKPYTPARPLCSATARRLATPSLWGGPTPSYRYPVVSKCSTWSSSA